MIRQSGQQGYVSDPIRKPHGIAFNIRYRVRTANGSYKHKAELLYGLSGKKAARAVLNQRLQSASMQKPETVDLTLGDFVETYWRPYLQRKQIKPSTIEGYESVLKCHILPILGNLRLVDIAPVHIEELLQVKNMKGLSSTTTRNVIVILKGILALAVEDDLIPRSPVRRKHKPVAIRRHKMIWSPEQLRSILAEIPTEHRALFTTAALTGVRVGELLGVQWKHVDFEDRKLRVAQAVWHGVIQTPKTSSSVRTILFNDRLSQVLTEHLQNSRNIGQDDFVFCNKAGASLNQDVLRRDVLYPSLDRLGLPRPKREAGFHAFRHSAGSLINAVTGNLKLAQSVLGHSDIATTADVYTHTSPESERGATMAIENAIFG